MKLASEYFNFTIDFTNNTLYSLVIEDPVLLHKFLTDLHNQIDGADGPLVLSEDNKVNEISRNVELISDFIEFSINRKSLLTKVIAALNAESLDSDKYAKTMKLINMIRDYILELQIGFDCNLDISGLSMESLLKAAGLSIEDCYEKDLEKLIDYFGLVRDFEKEKLFVLYDLRALFSFDDLSDFAITAIQKEYNILLVDAHAYPLLPAEKRFLIDEDLCEIY